MSGNMLKAEFSSLKILPEVLEALRGKVCLVTGATGLIGSYLVRYLLNLNDEHALSARVIALCRNEQKARSILGEPEERNDIEFVLQDVEAPLELNDEVDFIVHAASPADPVSFSTRPVETMKSNFLGTMHLLEFLKRQGHGRMLYVSSGEVYGELEKDAVKREEMSGYVDPMNPRSCYPSSKRAAETLCASYGREYEVEAVSVRLCYVYGPTVTDSNSRADAQFLRKAAAGENIVMKSEGLQRRSYCYVADAVTAMLTLLAKGQPGEAYNVASPHSNVTIRQYAETLAEKASVAIEFQLPDSMEAQGYSKISHAVLASEKLEALGWSSGFSLDEGLRQTLKIYRMLMEP